MMKKTTRKYVWLLIANALLLVAVGSVWQYRLHPPRDPDSRYLPSVTYMAGLTSQASFDDLKGQWTLLNLWASWCAPCIAEMPSLQKLANEYKSKGLRVIAVSLDEAKSADEIEALVKKHKFGDVARNWDDKGQIYAQMNPAGLPTTYLVDPSGKITHVFEGDRDWSLPDSRLLIDQSLDVSSGTTVNKSPTRP